MNEFAIMTSTLFSVNVAFSDAFKKLIVKYSSSSLIISSMMEISIEALVCPEGMVKDNGCSSFNL